jgi:hypothetical protein
MVEGLAKAAHFKQAIEEDETKAEIYSRLSTTLQKEFALRNSRCMKFPATRNR